MGSLFVENIPAANSTLQSAEIRDNFSALYDKVKSLEVRAAEDDSSILTISSTSGLIYFRPSTGNQLLPIPFPGTQLNILTSTFFKTKKDGYGSLYREIQNFTGPSQFQSDGPLLEVLLTLNKNMQLILTESAKGQNNRLSSAHFNLFFDDSEIPLALIFLEKNSDGSFKPISQTDIRDVRPFITSAFQNNSEIAEQQALIQDNKSRIDELEPGIKITNNLLVKLPSSAKLQADGYSSNNPFIEVTSGKAWCGEGSGWTRILKFAGGLVDFSINQPSTSRSRIYSAWPSNPPSPLPTDGYWNKAIIGLQYDSSSTDPVENSKIMVAHGVESLLLSNISMPILPTNTIPLATIIYQVKSGNVVPFLNSSFLGDTQLNYSYPIIDLTSTPLSDSAYISLTADLSETTASESTIITEWFPLNGQIDIYDSNTSSVRRVISQRSFNSSTKQLFLTVTSSFSDVSLARSPYIRSISKHKDLIEDLRPFVGIG